MPRSVSIDARLDVAPDPMAVREARAFIRSTLTQALDDHSLDTVVLLSSELITNAVLHAKTAIQVRVVRRRDVVRIEVADESSALPERRMFDFSSASGRGLAIVEAAAARWGVERAPGTAKKVWFEVAV